jgi:hypothetical protein
MLAICVFLHSCTRLELKAGKPEPRKPEQQNPKETKNLKDKDNDRDKA